MIIIKIVVLLLLLLLSKNTLVKQLSLLVHLMGGSSKMTISLWALIFLPGTVIHEISHFLLAALTGARTGKVEILPEFLDEEFASEGKKGVTLGYVQTGHLNPLQGFLVGIAPLISGVIIIIWLASLIPNSYQTKDYALLGLQIYFFLTVSNSFFPSWADIKQTLTVVVIFIIVLILGWMWGFNLYWAENLRVTQMFDSLSKALLISIGFNLFLIMGLKGIITYGKNQKGYYRKGGEF